VNELEIETQGLTFIDKLHYVVENGELEFWEGRKNPPNLSVDEFKLVLDRIEKVVNQKWILRISDRGKHAKSGEDECFKFTCIVKFGGLFELEEKSYFTKGYYFEKKNLIGVVIQSFREV
jgi:hypothetical protein